MAIRLGLKLAILSRYGTQRKFAGSIGLGEVRVSNIVRGIAVPSSTEQAAIESALGQDFFSETHIPLQPIAEARTRG